MTVEFEDNEPFNPPPTPAIGDVWARADLPPHAINVMTVVDVTDYIEVAGVWTVRFESRGSKRLRNSLPATEFVRRFALVTRPKETR